MAPPAASSPTNKLSPSPGILERVFHTLANVEAMERQMRQKITVQIFKALVDSQNSIVDVNFSNVDVIRLSMPYSNADLTRSISQSMWKSITKIDREIDHKNEIDPENRSRNRSRKSIIKSIARCLL